LARLAASPARTIRDPCYQEAVEAVRQLRRYALFFPIGRPRARLMSGCLLSLMGHRHRAQQRYRSALTLANGLGLPYEVALSHAHIAATNAPGSHERAEHLGQMHTLLERMNASVPSTTLKNEREG
jgi:hypothetical protein